MTNSEIVDTINKKAAGIFSIEISGDLLNVYIDDYSLKKYPYDFGVYERTNLIGVANIIRLFKTTLHIGGGSEGNTLCCDGDVYDVYLLENLDRTFNVQYFFKAKPSNKNYVQVIYNENNTVTLIYPKPKNSNLPNGKMILPLRSFVSISTSPSVMRSYVNQGCTVVIGEAINLIGTFNFKCNVKIGNQVGSSTYFTLKPIDIVSQDQFVQKASQYCDAESTIFEVQPPNDFTNIVTYVNRLFKIHYYKKENKFYYEPDTDNYTNFSGRTIENELDLMVSIIETLMIKKYSRSIHTCSVDFFNEASMFMCGVQRKNFST